MKEEQLYLFYEPTDQKLERKIEELKTQLDNTRRGLFYRHTAMGKLLLEMREEIDMLKAQKECRESKIMNLELYG